MDQSFYNQSSVLRINVMVVDDDPVFLQIMSRMLEKSKYRDPSIMEITVIAVKDSREALSTLKIERNNIDLIVTDYYMPGMNGLQLKKQITREFGNLPVIVMSSDTNKERESLTCGAMCFIPKPIKAIDLTKIYQFALTYKKNGKSILWTENNHKDTDVTIPQQIQLLPEQGNVFNTKKTKKCSSRLDSRTVNSSNDSCVSTDGSRKNLKRKPNDSSGDDVESLSRHSKKSKIKWTDYLQYLFLQAIRHIGLDKAVPKKILEFMNVSYLTRENVASHLQKYRQFLKKVAEKGSSHLSGRDINSISPYAHISEPYYNYSTPSTSWYNTSLNNRSFYSKPGHGLGQSRLLSNTCETVRFNQIPFNYMNRSSTYEPTGFGSNLTLPIKSNLNFSNQQSQNEGRRSFFEPTMNKTGQTSQVLEFGQHGLPANFNNDMVNSFGSLTPNQPRMSIYESLTLNQPEVISNHGSLTPNQPELNTYGSLIPNSGVLSNYESLTPNQPGPSHFSYDEMQSFLNSENATYKPHEPHANSPTQPNLEIPNMELPCNISNFQFDHNEQQREAASTTKSELPANFSTELNQIFSLEGDGDWTFVNINQGKSNGETSNTYAAPETNSPIFNMKPNQNQEQDDPYFIDWSLLDPQDLVADDFMESLFNNGMN